MRGKQTPKLPFGNSLQVPWKTLMKLKPLCNYYYTATITKLCAFISLLQALEEEWSHYEQLCEATLAFYNWGTRKQRAVMEFFQFVQNVSWSRQPYPMYKILHIAYNFNSKEHTWHLWQREIYCSSIKPWSQVKWPNLGTWIQASSSEQVFVYTLQDSPTSVIHHIQTESHF